MSVFHSHIDDPEKHFLGNLLSESDDSFINNCEQSSSPSSPYKGYSAGDRAPLSLGTVGVNRGSSTFWPEPPPPYSPPSGLNKVGSTWQGDHQPQFNTVLQSGRDAVDWDSLLFSHSYEAERSSSHMQPYPSAPLSAPHLPAASLPFSYRDVATRGVSSYSAGSSRLGSSSCGGKDTEIDRRDEAAIGKNEDRNGKNRANVKPSVQKKKSTQTNKGTSKSCKSRARIVSGKEINDPPPIEDSSRFQVLEKLAPKCNSNGLVTDEESAGKIVCASSTVRSDRRANGVGGSKGKKHTMKKDERKKRKMVVNHLAQLLVILRNMLITMACIAERFVSWLVELVVDVVVKCTSIIRYGVEQTVVRMRCKLYSFRTRVVQWWKREGRSDGKRERTEGLTSNVPLPETSEDALERLVSVKDGDAYCVLGVREDCSDDDIRMYYKRQALLVHPDKNVLHGAAEAFQILSKAFEAIGTAEARRKYDMLRYTSPMVEELQTLHDAFKKKMEESRNQMSCDCGETHTRVVSHIPQQAARYCKRCNTRHPAKSLDIWAESRLFGLVWVYYTCMNGVVYDISEWANCECNKMQYVKVDSHVVVYRLNANAQSNEAKKMADRYLQMLSQGLEKVQKNISTVDLNASQQAYVHSLEGESERPTKAKRAPKKK